VEMREDSRAHANRRVGSGDRACRRVGAAPGLLARDAAPAGPRQNVQFSCCGRLGI